MEWYVYLIAILGSMVAGVINTLAGNGSAITLSILTELIGLPGNIANATNRVGIASQSSVGTWVFYRHEKLDMQKSWAYILFTVIGSFVGIFVALTVSNEQFIQVFRFLLLIMFFVILVNPKRWLIDTQKQRPTNFYLVVPAFLLLGFYGGFIQMGMGVFFLAAMVLGAKYSLIDANAVKSAVVAIYTVVAVVIFHVQGLIDWPVGLLMALGQTIGGYLAAAFASKYQQANIWAHRILVAVVILALFKLFDVHLLFV